MGNAQRNLTLGVLMLALCIGAPVGLLIRHVYSQLRMEAYLQLKVDAEDLASKIDQRCQEIITAEEGRGFDEFSFLNVVGSNKNNGFLQRSPLSRFPVESRVPGIIGYFQLDPDGNFSSPLLPKDGVTTRYGLDEASLRARRDKEREVREILQKNGGVAPKAKTAKADDAFGQYEELKLDGAVASESLSNVYQRQKKGTAFPTKKFEPRKETVQLPEPRDDRAVKTFEGEIDPYQFGFLPTGQAVLYRKVWRDGKRHIQGALLDRAAFLDDLIRRAYDDSPLSGSVALAVHDGADLIAQYSPAAGGSMQTEIGRLISRHSLSAPFDDLHLAFTVRKLTTGSNVVYALFISGLVVLALILGLGATYVAGRRQIALARQQQDFVSAVSHELKTPLTSIRMYSEMLREGWATEDKKRGYYDYIFTESERLSRLIANVLQLARLSRGQELSLARMTATDAYGRVRELIQTQVQSAGFTLKSIASDTPANIAIDLDALTQIFVNLVDNAIKFSRPEGKTAIESGFELSAGGDEVRFFVRDFGPGIPRDQQKRIFELFYRGENELTRKTQGTGIGLSLVAEMARRMAGRVDVESEAGRTTVRVILPVQRT